MDNYQLEAITQELGKNLVTERVGHIYEPKRLSLVIGFRNGATLYISIDPTRPSLFLTSQLRKQAEAGNFTNLLRKYLSGAQLTAVQKQHQERRVELVFQNYDLTGSTLYLTLLVELTGRSANLHLYNGDVRLASLREGFQKEPERVTEESSIPKLSPLLSRELAHRASLDPEHALESLQADMRHLQPVVYYPEGGIEQIGLLEPGKNFLLASFKLEIAKGLKAKFFETMSAAAEFYYSKLETLQEYRSHKSRILSGLKTEISRLETMTLRIKADIAEFDKGLEYRRLGELILANLSTLSQRGNRIYLTDLYDPSQREIELEIAPNTTPQQAAADLFKKYQRARRGHKAASERLLEIERQLVEKRQEYERYEKINTEGFESFIQTRPKPKSDKRESGLTGIRRYLSSDGFEILVGRSDAGNEELTFRIARPNDIWLHTADYPGSHVLVRNPARVAVPQKTLHEAAQLAAYFSKARGETSAAVRYCERKMLSRPKKAKLGLVLLQQYKTLMVAPLEAGTRQL